MRRLLFLTMLLFVSTAICQAAKRPKIVKITVEPKEAAIYINNTLESSMEKINVAAYLSHYNKMDFTVLLLRLVL